MMKHLKKIFENKKEFDEEYIKYCFQDFLDDGFKIAGTKKFQIDRIRDKEKSKDWHGMVDTNLQAYALSMEKTINIEENHLIFNYQKPLEELRHPDENRTITSSYHFVDDFSEYGEKVYEFFEMMEQAKSRLKDQDYKVFYQFPTFRSEYNNGKRIVLIRIHCYIIQSYS